MLFQKNSSVNDLLGQKETDQVYSYTKNFCKYLKMRFVFVYINLQILMGVQCRRFHVPLLIG
jgi:hypothetical protein